MARQSLLLAGAGLSHGFGGRSDGDFRTADLPAGLTVAKQVHGTAVAAAARPGRSGLEADVLLAGAGQGAGVLTADCVPILLFDPEARLAAAVHAGWRGTLANVAGAAVRALEASGASRARLLAAIGPCIRACCYQVGPEVAEAFGHGLGEGVVHSNRHLDLPLANHNLLTALGISSDRLDVIEACTFCAGGEASAHAIEGTGEASEGAHLYFSHRRQGERSGRQLSWVRV